MSLPGACFVTGKAARGSETGIDSAGLLSTGLGWAHPLYGVDVSQPALFGVLGTALQHDQSMATEREPRRAMLAKSTQPCGRQCGCVCITLAPYYLRSSVSLPSACGYACVLVGRVCTALSPHFTGQFIRHANSMQLAGYCAKNHVCFQSHEYQLKMHSLP